LDVYRTRAIDINPCVFAIALRYTKTHRGNQVCNHGVLEKALNFSCNFSEQLFRPHCYQSNIEVGLADQFFVWRHFSFSAVWMGYGTLLGEKGQAFCAI
jgi:hypothetical protein